MLPCVQLIQCNNQQPLWHKMKDEHLKTYRNIMDTLLHEDDRSGISCNNFKCTDINHLKDIDELSTKVVQVCLQAADESIPSKASIEKEKVIPGWDRIVDKPRKDARFWHAIWKSCGYPNVGIVADIRRRTRALYHKAVKQCKREKESMISASMASSLETNNLTEFWRTVK